MNLPEHILQKLNYTQEQLAIIKERSTIKLFNKGTEIDTSKFCTEEGIKYQITNTPHNECIVHIIEFIDGVITLNKYSIDKSTL